MNFNKSFEGESGLAVKVGGLRVPDDGHGSCRTVLVVLTLKNWGCR